MRQQERHGTRPAKDLYVSQWFRRARAYVETTDSPWFILSAKYGLVAPNEVIASYEQTLSHMGVQERLSALRILGMAHQLLPGGGRTKNAHIETGFLIVNTILIRICG